MRPAKFLAILSLAPSALSFKIRAFSGDGCSGMAREVNVYDNTCADPVPTTRSFRVLAYGAGRQRAVFHKGSTCIGQSGDRSFWADGGSNDFLIDRCITLGYQAHAYGSRSS